MKIKLISLILLVALSLSLFVGCEDKNKVLTEAESYAIVYKHAGVAESDVLDPHLHVLAENGVGVYNIHFTANNISYDYTINSRTGEILSAEP